MSREHVVKTHQVPLLPLKAHGIGFIYLADVIHDRIFDRCAVPVVDMAGQIFSREEGEKRLAYLWLKAMNMVQLDLIEEGQLVRPGMTEDRAASLTETEIRIVRASRKSYRIADMMPPPALGLLSRRSAAN